MKSFTHTDKFSSPTIQDLGNYRNNPDVSFAEKGGPNIVRLWIKNHNPGRYLGEKNIQLKGGFRKWMRPPAFIVREYSAKMNRLDKARKTGNIREDQMRRLEEDGDHGSTDINMSNPLVEKFIKEYEAGSVGKEVSPNKNFEGKRFHNTWFDFHGHNSTEDSMTKRKKLYYFRFYDKKKPNMNVGTLKNRYTMGSYRMGTIWNPMNHDS